MKKEAIFMIYTTLFLFFVIFIIYQSACHNNFDGSWYVGQSKIHGKGVFSNNDIQKGVLLFEAIDDNKKISYLGSLINHCNVPNTKLVPIGNKYYLMSIANINKNDELIANYYDTPNFIKKPDSNWTC